MSKPMTPPGGVSAPSNPVQPVDSSFEWTEEDKQNRITVLEAVRNGNRIDNFDYLFTKYVLNAPPNQDDIKIDGKDRTGRNKETEHIPINILRLLADELFLSWSVWDVIFHQCNVINSNGATSFKTICCVNIKVTYPVTGTERTFAGASDSKMNQNTAAEALIALATKNALNSIGRVFGSFIYAKLDRNYQDEDTSRVDQVLSDKDSSSIPPQIPVQPPTPPM